MEKRLLLIFVALLTVIGSFAQGKYVTVDGLKYFLRSDSKEAILFANSYSGDITVPEKITDEGVEYTVTAFADDCFKECESLTSVTIPSSVTSLPNQCFKGCWGLISITIPESVTSFDKLCFFDCESLTSITIPSSVTSMGNNCFDYCTGLTTITIPESVTSLPGGCFANCFGLSSITIPSSVTSLGYECFEDCSGLTSITIPESVKSIGSDCFSGCKNLTNITCKNPTPPYLAADAFDDNTYLLSTLYVPNVDAYRSADGWKNFKSLLNISTDNINAAKMRGVVVAAEGGIVTVSGLSDGEKVEFYATDGKLVGSQKAVSGTASIATSEPVVICKMGSASIKILVK